MAQNIPTQLLKITEGFHFKPKIACTKASIRSLTHIVFTYLSLIITSN